MCQLTQETVFMPFQFMTSHIILNDYALVMDVHAGYVFFMQACSQSMFLNVHHMMYRLLPAFKT